MTRLGFFQLTTMTVEWLADDEEEFSRVVWMDGNAVRLDQRYTENIFSGDAYEAFIAALYEIISVHSRSMISGYSQHH